MRRARPLLLSAVLVALVLEGALALFVRFAPQRWWPVIRWDSEAITVARDPRLLDEPPLPPGAYWHAYCRVYRSAVFPPLVRALEPDDCPAPLLDNALVLDVSALDPWPNLVAGAVQRAYADPGDTGCSAGRPGYWGDLASYAIS